MPIVVISTTGTSVFTNSHDGIKEDWKAFSKRSDIDLESISRKGIETFNDDARKLYKRTLEHLQAEVRSGSELRRASAELNSLTQILSSEDEKRNRNNDCLYFLATDTPDGALAARILADFCEKHFGIKESKALLIQGLQVSNGQLFQRDGVRNLIAKIFDVLESKESYRRVINPTGGFKGVVPYLTLIGMIEPDIEISYIYEQSNELMTLGRIPIQLDFDRLKDTYPVLARCNDMVDENQLRKLLNLTSEDSLTNHPIWSLLEHIEEGNQVYFSMNGLGLIVYKRLKPLYAKKIYLSKQASDRFDKLDSTQQKKIGGYFEQSRDKNWIDQKRHDEYKNPGKAICIKPGNVNERLFIYESDTEILIAEIAFHKPDGSYDTEPKSRQSYTNHRLWEKD